MAATVRCEVDGKEHSHDTAITSGGVESAAVCRDVHTCALKDRDVVIEQDCEDTIGDEIHMTSTVVRYRSDEGMPVELFFDPFTYTNLVK